MSHYIRNGDVYCQYCGGYVDKLSVRSFLRLEHSTIRTVSALNKILENLDRIPIEELEKLGDKYGI